MTRDRLMKGLSTRTPTVISLVVILAAGFFAKFYAGPAHLWVNDSVAGMFYVIFWCVLASVFFTRAAPRTIIAAVFSVTCVLEVLQLWHPPFLESLRNPFLGRALLGHSFAWSDFPYYALGGGIGWFWIVGLRRRRYRSTS